MLRGLGSVVFTTLYLPVIDERHLDFRFPEDHVCRKEKQGVTRVTKVQGQREKEKLSNQNVCV